MILIDAESYLPGPTISLCQMEHLAAYRPDWSQVTGNVVENYMLDERKPNVCYVYPSPPADGEVVVEIVYVADPIDCATVDDPVSIPDDCVNALTYLTVAIALEQYADGSTPNRATYYRSLAAAELGKLSDGDLKGSPNLADEGGSPPRVLKT